MKKLTFITFVILSFIVGLAAACSSGSNTATTNNNTPAANTSATNTAAKTDEDVPASVKAAFPEAQSFTKQHKDIPADSIASIEKDTGGKVPDKDHHSYLAFASKDGKRTQIGAATVVKAGGKDLVVVYENKEGSPFIKEIRADGVAKEFLAQFAGKGHDDSLLLGADIKTGGADEKTAKAITEAVRIDVLTMQSLYGAAHKH